MSGAQLIMMAGGNDVFSITVADVSAGGILSAGFIAPDAANAGGAVVPASYLGNSIVAVYSAHGQTGNPEYSPNFVIGLEGSHPQDFFSAVRFPGSNSPTTEFAYDDAFNFLENEGVTFWFWEGDIWDDSDIGLVKLLQIIP